MDGRTALDALWPLIEETNKEISWETRLKEMVMFAKDKSLKRVLGKGTTNRRATAEDYAEEIETFVPEEYGADE
jgi:hypothetical protein